MKYFILPTLISVSALGFFFQSKSSAKEIDKKNFKSLSIDSVNIYKIEISHAVSDSNMQLKTRI